MSDFCDVLVIGAGTSGIPCALAAHAAGARVIVVDKAPVIGGTLHVSGGHMSAAGTRRQRSRGIEDSPEAHQADIKRINHGTARADIVDLAVRLAPATIDWLEAEGFEFEPTTPRILYGHEPYSVARTYYGPRGGLSILAVLERLVAQGGIDLRLNTGVSRLLVGPDCVEGAALADGGEIRARCIVLATGGYGANGDLFHELDGRPLVTSAVSTSTGDGLVMARQIGAAVAGRGTFIPTFGGLPDPDDPSRVQWGQDRPRLISTERVPWEIYVDRHGRRFVAEDEPSIDAKERCLAKLDDLTFWMVLDDRAVEESQEIVAGWSPPKLRAQANVRPGVWVAGTLAELGQRAGIDPAGLESTVAGYNESVRSERDQDFGRHAMPAPISRAPYYALRNHGVTLITFCGVDVDEGLRVRRADGSVINGLYAVGEVLGAGATSGNAFCGGMMVTPAISLGRWLGTRLAAGVAEMSRSSTPQPR
jgi:succinate dehydrogenase/fumarate reductase flavoprotein subunit